ncbi:hypothetical protein Daus18300_014243 [Diaporthe australafricana]|uniref:Uncharacterized protein n=1 Tax=Diaporthe australafricana TaxID=127596 RepID=A0ABR3VW02_9PEZI
MANIQLADDELATTRDQLAQALKQLTEKEEEISALKQDLARLRQSTSSDDAAGPDSPSSSPEQQTAEQQFSGVSFTINDTKEPTDASPDEHGEFQTGDVESVYSCSGTDGAASFGGWSDEATPISQANDSTETSAWNQGWSNTSSTCAWTDNSATSWSSEVPGSTGTAAEEFQPGQIPNWETSRLQPGSKSWLHPLSFQQPSDTMTDATYKDLIDLHVLPPKTRLEDEDWLNSGFENIRVDDEVLFRLLTKGRELAQKCLWAHMDKHRPNIRKREFPAGWQQVKLEVTALRESLGFGSLSYRGNHADLARDSVFKVVPLGHLTCHWNHRDLAWSRQPAARLVDSHLKNVQKLAIHLYDEERAMEARKLRDEARHLVEETVSELEALEPLFDEYAWKFHHHQMFEQVQFANEEGDIGLFKFPDVVFRAADAWSRRCTSLTKENEALKHQQTDEPQPDEPEIHQSKALSEKNQSKTEGGSDKAEAPTRRNFTIRGPSRRHSICLIKT